MEELDDKCLLHLFFVLMNFLRGGLKINAQMIILLIATFRCCSKGSTVLLSFQMPMSNIHMHQSQSITVTNQMQQQQQHTSMPQLNQNNSQQAQLQQQQQQQAPPQQQTSQTPQQNNSLSNFNPTADFNFEFFDSLPTTDTTLTDQELLNSFDSDAGFNLVDF